MNNFILALHEIFTWRAALDIFLIAVGNFFLYRTFVRLGTWKIFLGILTAFLGFVFANMLHLEGTSWIFQNVSQVAALALIVIFQPELRKVLEKLVSLHPKQEGAPHELLAETIATSLWQLARRRQGAIIVYPGNEPIAESLTGGHVLTAEASIPLIMSIFDPNSPGHDGAVIIENNRLANFGVRLPMSQTARLPEEYGTRHHAAMGLAEVTDALILVVSEERGTISAFANGAMQRLETISDIVRLIRNHQEKHGLFIIEKLGIIDRRSAIQGFCSLLIATIFWTGLAAANRQIIERIISLPIEYESPADGLVLVGEKNEDIRIRIAGPKVDVDEYVLSQPTVHINLANMVEGKQTVLISENNLKLPEKISFMESVPSQIEVNLATIVKRSIPVVPQLLGSLPNNLELEKVTVIPKTIDALVPPQRHRDKSLTVSTTPVYLNSVTGNSRILCKIIASPTIQPENKPWQDVEVLIEIAPKKISPSANKKKTGSK
jgi:uncharacterized protein (TIGR00159 family)